MSVLPLENAMSKEEVIAAIQESSARLGHVPTFAEVRQATQMAKHEIRKHFLTYANALSECGLQRNRPMRWTQKYCFWTGRGWRASWESCRRWPNTRCIRATA